MGHAFNQFLAEHWGYARQNRLFAAPMLFLDDLDKAVAETEWIIRHGARIVLMPFGPAQGRSPADPIPTDPQWAGTPEHEAWLDWMRRWHSGGDVRDSFNVYAYSVAQTIEQVLRQCGDELTRDNVMRQAANLNFTLPMLLPGVRVKTSPDDYFPIESLQLFQFDGTEYQPIGEVISYEGKTPIPE